VLLAMDQDGQPATKAATEDARVALQQAGYEVVMETWDGEVGKGIDDLLAAGHRPQLAAVPPAKPPYSVAISPPWGGAPLQAANFMASGSVIVVPGGSSLLACTVVPESASGNPASSGASRSARRVEATSRSRTQEENT